ncbi:hypothetical protein ANCCAN_05305 [Ancylostoma caninum]|uniref:Uncharacterized protein n=1 Tax=Ancylostoma caninum TaxID=29170 RepID=A0A368GWC2_ANCCA|nr:hypothetical protein ANCCAN_05305 [Ancylostoma caninum]
MRNICAERNRLLPRKESPNERCQSACEELKCRKGTCFKVPGTGAKTCKCSFCFEWNNPKDKKNRRDKGIFRSLWDKINSLPR